MLKIMFFVLFFPMLGIVKLCKVLLDLVWKIVCNYQPRLGWKNYNSLGTEEDKPIPTYIDKNMRWFVRQSIKGGRVCAFIQYYISEICDYILKCKSEEWNEKGIVYDIVEAHLDYKNKHLEIIKKEYESNFNDYRDIDEEEKKINQWKIR